MNILGVKVDNLEKNEILSKVTAFLVEEKFHQIATINPEFILEAQKNVEFGKILEDCDLNIADGIGIRFAFWRSGKNLKFRMAGMNLMMEILKIADKKKLKIFLAANSGGLSTWEKTRNAILKNHPDLTVDGINLEKNGVLNTNLESKMSKSDIIFCNFGAPEQEKFLHSLKSQKNGKIKLTMGVGGSFDFLTESQKRAPIWMRKAGLEWFWRFVRQPWRWKRIWKAVVIFPIKVIFNY